VRRRLRHVRSPSTLSVTRFLQLTGTRADPARFGRRSEGQLACPTRRQGQTQTCCCVTEIVLRRIRGERPAVGVTQACRCRRREGLSPSSPPTRPNRTINSLRAPKVTGSLKFFGDSATAHRPC
jgi:hypothetical protein